MDKLKAALEKKDIFLPLEVMEEIKKWALEMVGSDEEETYYCEDCIDTHGGGEGTQERNGLRKKIRRHIEKRANWGDGVRMSP